MKGYYWELACSLHVRPPPRPSSHDSLILSLSFYVMFSFREGCTNTWPVSARHFGQVACLRPPFWPRGPPFPRTKCAEGRLLGEGFVSVRPQSVTLGSRVNWMAGLCSVFWALMDVNRTNLVRWFHKILCRRHWSQWVEWVWFVYCFFIGGHFCGGLWQWQWQWQWRGKFCLFVKKVKE